MSINKSSVKIPNHNGSKETSALMFTSRTSGVVTGTTGNTSGRRRRRIYKENRKFFCCYPLKCSILVMGILLMIILAIEIFNWVLIYNNEYFESIYGVVYLSILLIHLGSAVLMLLYFVMDDSQKSRSFVPWSFLLAAISEMLIAIWITVFIYCIYDKPKVYIFAFERYDFSSPSGNDESKRKYIKENKNVYVYTHLILPICASVLFFIFFCVSSRWAQRHYK